MLPKGSWRCFQKNSSLQPRQQVIGLGCRPVACLSPSRRHPKVEKARDEGEGLLLTASDHAQRRTPGHRRCCLRPHDKCRPPLRRGCCAHRHLQLIYMFMFR